VAIPDSVKNSQVWAEMFSGFCHSPRMDRMAAVTARITSVRMNVAKLELMPATAFDFLHESHQSRVEVRSVVDPGNAHTLMNQSSNLSGFRRISYLAPPAAACSWALGGLVLPGIPTVPFLVASSFFSQGPRRPCTGACCVCPSWVPSSRNGNATGVLAPDRRACFAS
jgi:hypothetical protein